MSHHNPRSKPHRRWAAWTAATLLLHPCHPVTHSSLRPKRKNNTGFYYGVRDDDIRYFSNPTNHPLYTPTSRIQSDRMTRRKDAGIIANASLRKRTRRKNNTGFYYGVREDVFFPRVGRSQSDSWGNRVGRETPDENGRELDDSSVVQSPADTGASPSTTSTIERVPPVTKLAPLLRKDENLKKNRGTKKIQSPPPNNASKDTPEPMASSYKDSVVHDTYGETLSELRGLKDEIIALREELRAIKSNFVGELTPIEKTEQSSKWWSRPRDEVAADPIEEKEPISHVKPNQRTRLREFEQIGKDVENWASRMIFNGEENSEKDDGWKKVSCSKFVWRKFNPDGRTRVYLKWMPDSRYDHVELHDNAKPKFYPCIKCYSTVDAPMDRVCSFLADAKTIPLYNELVDDHCDLEVITPHSKITWCKLPKVLFVKPRDFVTFCSHRWRKDGTQVVVNQACEHDDMPGIMEEGEGDVCRGFALRGANFISRDPSDANKTCITMLAHANPGGGLPQWAMNTAVNAVAQIEPFRLFHNINEGVHDYVNQPFSSSSKAQLASVNNLSGRSTKPAGLSQLGYACFWPEGGGLKEKTKQTSNDDENVAIDEG